MAIGRGYFWSGLSRGIEGLYGHTMNQKMAQEAQDARAEEGRLNRAARETEFNRLFPTKDDSLTKTFSEFNEAVKSAETAAAQAAKAASDLKYGDPKAFAAAQAAYRKAQAEVERLKIARDSVGSKAATHVGGSAIPSKIRANKKDEFMQSLLDGIE